MSYNERPTSSECPYCGLRNPCRHLVLRVDLHNQRATNGPLAKAFDARWRRIVKEEGQDDWGDPWTLWEFLNQFTIAVDFDLEWDFEGGPGQSVTYWDFYLKTRNGLAKARRHLNNDRVQRERSGPTVPVVAGIDLEFRPRGYQADRDPVAAITQNILGEHRRRMVSDFVQGHVDPAEGPIDERLLDDLVDDDTRRGLGRVHPSFMGGEYLPRYQGPEFEIARLVMDSVTQDVISIRARRRHGGTRYRYRIVDEYESTFALKRQTSTRPLSLRELIHLIDTATSEMMAAEHERMPEGIIWWQVHEYGEDADAAAGFLRITSTVYPQLETYYRKRLRAWVEGEVAARAAEDEGESAE